MSLTGQKVAWPVHGGTDADLEQLFYLSVIPKEGGSNFRSAANLATPLLIAISPTVINKHQPQSRRSLSLLFPGNAFLPPSASFLVFFF